MASSILTQALLATAEKGLNRLLQSDSHAISQLAKLANKVIVIQSNTYPKTTLVMLATEQGVYLSSNSELPGDCKITASAPLLLQLLLTANKQELLANSNIIIMGEASLAFTFCHILENLNPDWQHELAQWINPTAVSSVSQAIKSGSEQLQTGLHFIQHQMGNLAASIIPPSGIDKTSNANPVTDLLSLLHKTVRRS